MPLSRAFRYIFFRFPSKGVLLAGSPVKELPLQVPLTETPLREILLSTTLFYISPGVLNKKGHLIKSHLPIKVPAKGAPPMVPQRGPYRERCSVSRTNGLIICIYLSEAPVKESFQETGGKHMVTVHGAPRLRKEIVYDTAVTTPVPCSLQHDTFHLVLGRPEPC